MSPCGAEIEETDTISRVGKTLLLKEQSSLKTLIA